MTYDEFLNGTSAERGETSYKIFRLIESAYMQDVYSTKEKAYRAAIEMLNTLYYAHEAKQYVTWAANTLDKAGTAKGREKNGLINYAAKNLELAKLELEEF